MLKIKNDASLKLLSECAFKVKRTRTKVASAESLYYQWAPKGSCRLAQLLKGISHLQNGFHMFTP